MRRIRSCCAYTASGHAAVAPPRSVMKSRRFTAEYLPCFRTKGIAHRRLLCCGISIRSGERRKYHSRRFIRSPRLRGRARSPAAQGRAPWRSLGGDLPPVSPRCPVTPVERMIKSDPRPQVVRHPTRSAVRMEEPAGPADRCPARALWQTPHHRPSPRAPQPA
jgi:hypothetical protein